MRLTLALLLAAAVAAAPASARMHSPYRGHRIIPANAGALDGLSAASGAYSFRKLRTAYAGSAVKLQRVDTTTQDIGFTAAGDFDTAAAAAFCTTACTVTTWYDQSGNARHLVQATAANQPAYIANCNGALPCFQATTGTQALTGPSVTPATGVVSFAGVFDRSVGTQACQWLRQNGGNNRWSTNLTANTWLMQNTGSMTAAAADNVWHVAQGIMNGAASVLAIDGVETTGTVTGNTTAGLVTMTGTSSTTCNWEENLVWDAYVLTPAERQALTNNQRNYWAPAPLDSFTQPSGAYSFRKLKSTYAGPAIRLRRASDNAELDINFLGCTPFTGCPWDEAAALAHCASTTCFVVTAYDQSGNARHLTQATQANQMPLVFGCNGALPCMRTVGNVTTLVTVASITPATGVVSVATVGRRVAGTGICTWLRQNGGPPSNRLATFAGANQWSLLGGTSGSINPAVTDNLAHSGVGVINGAASVLSIDGVETAGTATGSVTAGQTQIIGGAATTCDFFEAVDWDAYSLTPAERAALIANHRSFWGTP